MQAERGKSGRNHADGPNVFGEEAAAASKTKFNVNHRRAGKTKSYRWVAARKNSFSISIRFSHLRVICTPIDTSLWVIFFSRVHNVFSGN